jgi:hypothetical protein
MQRINKQKRKRKNTSSYSLTFVRNEGKIKRKNATIYSTKFSHEKQDIFKAFITSSNKSIEHAQGERKKDD